MKKTIKLAVVMLAAATVMVGCNNAPLKGFKQTKSGLMYKFEETNKSGEQPKVGDVIVGEMIFRLDNDTLLNTQGDPQRLLMIRDSVFKGYDIDEGLLMMHVGDKAIFAIYADSVAKYFQPNQLPGSYKADSGMVFYYEIKLTDIVTKQEIEQEQANFQTEMEERKANEPEAIAKYVADNNITAQPNADGMYIVVNKRGNGPKVATGKTVKINYTGRLLDGTMFDSSVESDAKEGGIYEANRPYMPLEYTVGQMSLIKGWEDGVMDQPEGTKLTLVMPSSLAYGERGGGKLIPPFSPLRFDLEIVSVK